jgi:hypothetical protein
MNVPKADIVSARMHGIWSTPPAIQVAFQQIRTYGSDLFDGFQKTLPSGVRHTIISGCAVKQTRALVERRQCW